MSELKKKLIEVSNIILDQILEHRKKNPGFTMSLRERDSGQSDEKRLEKGQWFQGSHYIYVPFFKKGDKDRKVKTIGFVLNFNADGAIAENYLEISCKGGDFTNEEILFHQELAKNLDITLNDYNCGTKWYDNPNDYKNNLNSYLTDVYTLAIGLLEKYNLKSSYLIDEASFLKRLAKIESIKTSMSFSADELSDNFPFSSFDLEGKFPLNTILFGPPGTGKTYNTINKALEIIGVNIADKSRHEIKSLFDDRLKNGQIVFTTFHQSMSYEDFIEGIKPVKPSAEDAYLKYDIEDGVFKKLCNEAKSNFENARSENSDKYPFEIAFEKLKEDWDVNMNMKFPLKTEGYEFTITGFTNTSIQFKKASGGTSHTLSINTLKELYYGKEFNFKQGVGIYYPGVLTKINSYSKDIDNSKPAVIKPYVLIIDEINRGNVSQIFGELITLIEDDKREGSKEALSAVLPYSKEQFSVPKNLYILGTMNTADRSVEALDSALRRRFIFEEMMPKPALLATEIMYKNLWDQLDGDGWDEKWINAENAFFELTGGSRVANEALYKSLEGKSKIDFLLAIQSGEYVKFEGINLKNVLEVINDRIELLLDRDHLIGHSYFLNIYSLKELKEAFFNCIIPLLQEYFYGDYGKIGLVVGAGFVSIKREKIQSKFKFANFKYDYEEILERPVYELKKQEDVDIHEAIKLLLNVTEI